MLDQIDRKILAALGDESDVTSARLGERVGLSPSAAHRRVKLLEAAGLIAGYRAKLSREARGNPSIFFVSVTLKDQANHVSGGVGHVRLRKILVVTQVSLSLFMLIAAA